MLIKREITDELRQHLGQKEITLIVGPRQAGKTTLMLLLKNELEERHERTLFFNLDVELDRQFFASQSAFLRKLELELGQNRGYVFIDEIQRKEDAGLFLKGLYDMGLPYKFIISGSGSVELKEKIHESLAGRKRLFELSTLTFTEFAHFKTGYAYENKLEQFFDIDGIRTTRLLEEYLNFGGYPRMVLAETNQEKQKVIDEIYRSFLERDIVYLLGITKEEAFTNLVRMMAREIGALVNISALSSTLGISAKTVQNYLWYLQKTFILFKVSPYFKNVRKEIAKAPLFYFLDLGLRNYAAGTLGRATESSENGFLFENLIALMLHNRVTHTSHRLHFWRSKDGAAVDFILDTGKTILPIEVKWGRVNLPKIGRSLRRFLEVYHPKEAFVINQNFSATVRIGASTVRFLPFHKIPLFLEDF